MTCVILKLLHVSVCQGCVLSLKCAFSMKLTPKEMAVVFLIQLYFIGHLSNCIILALTICV